MHFSKVIARSALTTAALSLGAVALRAQEAVSLQELEGRRVSATIVKAQIVRREGRDIPTRHTNNLSIAFGPDGRLVVNNKNTIHGPKGERPGENVTETLVVETPGRTQGRGGGAGLYVFENGTLTRMRTYASGAFMRKIEFKRTPKGLACTATEVHARENGTGAIRLKSSTDGQMVTIVSSRQISSRCEVAR